MQLLPADNLICPLDSTPLTSLPGGLACPHGHRFDQARQGYFHLLPVQAKRSREPGDSKGMVEARRRLLDSGLYRPISDLLNELIVAYLPTEGIPRIADAGCGEGYYLARLAHTLAAQGRPEAAQLIGWDIAKPAVQAASRRRRDITWLVATHRTPCLQSASLDLLFCMFGFPTFTPFAEMLRLGGHLLLVDGAEEHLLELREVIYPEVRRRPPPSLTEALACGFELLTERALHYRTAPLDRQQLTDLLTMTPHLYRAPHAGKLAAAALDQLAVTVDVRLRLLLRRPQ